MKERLWAELERALQKLLHEAGQADRELPAFVLEVPRNPEHGDFACNAALLLAKCVGRPPRAVAEELAQRLRASLDFVESVEIAGPGFLNFRLAQASWRNLLCEILAAAGAYGHSAVGAGQRVQVEFVSANPTGPLTLGHGRQAVLGDCIARLLEASGFAVTREYYFNDGGRQMRVLGQSVRARYFEQCGRAAAPSPELLGAEESAWPQELEGLPVLFPRDGYWGDYIGEIAAALREKYGDALLQEADETRFRDAAVERIFAEIRQTLDRLGIAFDVYYNEKSLYDSGKLAEVLKDLRAEQLVYEADGAVWLRATTLGLDRDRVLVKSSGEPTYLLPDIAYHREKFRRQFEQVIDIQGADHIEQFPFVRAAAAALGCPADRIELVMHQFVTLTRGGEQVKQSTRRATYVTVDELLEQVGNDVFRFFMIQRKADGHLDFDLDLATETDWKKNPAYYVQYAHARARSIQRKAAEQGVLLPKKDSLDPSSLVLTEELALLKKLAEFPEVVARATEAREPHHVAYYLREVAGMWNPYLQDGIRHRVLSEDAALSTARLGLVGAVQQVLANGLALLGLSAPEQM